MDNSHNRHPPKHDPNTKQHRKKQILKLAYNNQNINSNKLNYELFDKEQKIFLHPTKHQQYNEIEICSKPKPLVTPPNSWNLQLIITNSSIKNIQLQQPQQPSEHRTKRMEKNHQKQE
eukprot:Pgem_evm1s444